MREIKFRVVDEETGQVFSGDEIEERYQNITVTLSYGELVAFYVSSAGDFENLKLIEYTGLNDKNGVEIYEGDLVRAGNMKNNNIFEVVYGRCSFEFIRETGSRYRADQLSLSDVKVVSNIFKTGKSLKLDILYQDPEGKYPNLPF